MNKILVTVLAVLHLIATLWHGSLHSHLRITLPTGQTAFVVVVILVVPFAGAALGWTRYGAIGMWLFFTSMLAAFLFGVYHHYVLVSPDNIHYLPDTAAQHGQDFTSSAAVIAVLELAASLYGAYCIGLRGVRSERNQSA